jgi:acetoin:2,6-dichlorophenolindophenol oxidoreductase subunit alpha
MSAPVTETVETAKLEQLYERMLRIRLLEDVVNRLFLNNEIEGTTHLYSGQEAVAVGFCDILEKGDSVSATYRGHGVALALGVDQTALLAEFLGRGIGTNGGRGGSMNVISLEHGLIGCFGIVGGSIASATGTALAAQLTGDGSVSVAFFGDGAANQGVFFESLNLAALWQVPVVFVCENNGYTEFTPTGAVTAGESIAARAEPFGIPSLAVDGDDVAAVAAAAAEATGRARRGGGPSLLECRTNRWRGHHEGEESYARPYRESVEATDPIDRLVETLGASGVDGDGLRSALEAEERAAVAEALGAAEAEPEPSAERALEDVFA